jgi:menaquinone-dependent protoporphyrinogen oxidase
MNNVLVAYASKHGSTAEIAEAIAQTLRESDLTVDCKVADEVKTLEGYDAVVLGSAVYMKRWRSEARHFLSRHGKALATMPFWVFSSGPIGDPADAPDEKAEAWAEPRRTIEKAEGLGVREHVVFGGRVPADPHGPIQKAMVENTPAEWRDRRDWDAIRDWARGIGASLVGEAALR